ncbi:MAG: 3-hydroxyacyl-CoA dehydrogenase family protein [Clostridia bacterium]|nr:3-hydroxyacyl-CoA dehydrogenase family protein [Clostridia bacterium]
MKQKEIHQVLIAGAGVMGASFAQIYAKYGYEVILYDIQEAAIGKARALIAVNQKAEVEEGNLSAEASQALLSRITMTTGKEGFASADFVLEAIAEKMEIKHAFWREVSIMAKPEAILATNTSGLSISKIAEAVQDPGRFAGMHWVNPPHLIPLVEVIAGEQSTEEVLDTISEVALSLRQKPVRVMKDPAGFILNRLQYAVVREACHCVEMGYASMEGVDDVMKYGLGMRYACIGPFETMDFGGIDIFNHVGSYLFDELCNDGGVPKILKEAYEEGRYGVKNEKGFFDYSGGKGAEALAKRDAAFIKLNRCLYGDEK